MPAETYYCPKCRMPVFAPGTRIYSPEDIADCSCQHCGRRYTPEDVVNQAKNEAAKLLREALSYAHRPR